MRKSVAFQSEMREDRGSFVRFKAVSERSLSDRLSGKSVVLVHDDFNFDVLRQTISHMVESDLLPRLRLANWTALIEHLPTMNADLLIIASISPHLVTDTFDQFQAGLRTFRENNPRAAIIMLNIYPVISAGKMIEQLEADGLIDSSDNRAVSIISLMHEGASAHEAKL